MTGHESLKEKNALVISFWRLRKLIGLLGIALPPVVFFVGWLLFGETLQGSISQYYHTGSRNFFVGILCAIGVFMISYEGYPNRSKSDSEDDASTSKEDPPFSDNDATNVAGLLAILVAVLPPPSGTASGVAKFVGWAHWGAAASFFVTLAYICWFNFRMTHSRRPLDPEKEKRNRLYRQCALAIAGSLLGIGLYYLVGKLSASAKTFLEQFRPIFVFETIGVWAFGLAWLTKGQTRFLFKDAERARV